MFEELFVYPKVVARHRDGPELSNRLRYLKHCADINTVRGWLGHVSLDTTNVYAEVDFETKAKALEKCAAPNLGKMPKRWRDQPALMDFLGRCSRLVMWRSESILDLLQQARGGRRHIFVETT